MARHAAIGVGVVAALGREARALTSLQTGGWRLDVAGPGPAAAARAADRLIAAGSRLLISWGSAGALGGADSGTIILPAEVVDERGRCFALDPALTAAAAGLFDGVAPVLRGRLVTVGAPVATPAAKAALAQSSGALAVDMESAAVVGRADATGCAALVIRAIVDRADQVVPAAALAALDGRRIRIGRMLGPLLRRPGQIPELVALGRASGQARRALAGCARRLGDADRVAGMLDYLKENAA